MAQLSTGQAYSGGGGSAALLFAIFQLLFLEFFQSLTGQIFAGYLGFPDT